MQRRGERQFPLTLDQIKGAHLNRYVWARDIVSDRDDVIDAGCGVGYGSTVLAERVASVVGMDVSLETVSLAKHYWKHPKVRFLHRELHGFTSAASFSSVVAFEVIEHLVLPELFLLRVRKEIGPGGTIFISSPNSNVKAHSVAKNPFHIRHYTAQELRQMLVACGFNVIGTFSQSGSEEIRHTPDDADGKIVICAGIVDPYYEMDRLAIGHLTGLLPQKFQDAMIDRCRAIRVAQGVKDAAP